MSIKIKKPKKENRKDIEIIQYVEDFFSEYTEQKTEIEKRWFLYLAFYSSKQWVRWNEDSSGLFTPRSQVNGREYLSYNKIKPYIKEQVALLNSTTPLFEVIPENSEKKALDDADICSKLIPFIDKKTKNGLKNIKLDNWVLVFGSAYKMITWNEKKGKVKKDGTYEGDLFVEILSPFNIVKPSLNVDLEDNDKLMLLKYRSLSWILNKFPKVKEKDLLDKGGKEISGVFKRVDSMLNQNRLEENTMDEEIKYRKKPILVKYLFEKPNTKFPKGRTLILANRVLLNGENDPLPYNFMQQDGTWNIIEYKYNYDEYQYKYCSSVVEDMMDAQKNFNIMNCLLLENLQATAKNKLFYNEDLIINKKDLEPGDNIAVPYSYTGVEKAGQTPAYYLSGNPMNSDVLNASKIADEQMQTASGTNEALLGKNPPNVRSTSHLMFMVEQSTKRMGIYAQLKEVNEAEFYEKALKLMKQFYSNDRLVELVGKDEVISVDKFKKEKIAFSSVKVIKGSSAPMSKALQTEQLVTLAQTLAPVGAFPMELLPTVLSNLGYNDIKRFQQKFDIDTKNSVRENGLIEQGLPVELNPFEKMDVHLLEHKNEYITESFSQIKDLPMEAPVVIGVDPQTGQPIEQEMTRGQYMMMHIQQTAQAYAAQVQQRFMQMQQGQIQQQQGQAPQQ